MVVFQEMKAIYWMKGRKRTRSPKSWKRNIAKVKRLRGEEYKLLASYKCNKAVPGRDIKDHCPFTCRRFRTRVTEDQRKHLHSSFWKDFDSWE